MKRLSLLLCFSLTAAIGCFGQTEKADLVDAIAQKHYQLPSLMVENFVTLNLSPEIWKKMADSPTRPIGVTTFGNLGMSISKYLDYTQKTTLNKLCGFGVEDNSRKSNFPICEDQIKESKGKISITVNATNVRLTEDSYMLLMMAVGRVDEFLSKTEGTEGVREGWKSKAKTLLFVINTGKSEADLGAKWNADFSECTITTSPYIQVPAWGDKIMNVLKKGVANYQ